MNSEQTIVVDYNVYLKLIDDARMYHALEQAGVDNWDGYDYALEIRFGKQPNQKKLPF